ncbi:MAG: hypothetical protein H7707_03385, partial [Acetobacter sp.]|nr:hypothetical protein [Acetobacter sp.]
IKHYYDEKEDQNKYQIFKNWLDEYLNKKGTTYLNNLFPEIKGIFETPKPVELIKVCLENICDEKDSIILDFFAGSGTTGHAVMQYNAEHEAKSEESLGGGEEGGTFYSRAAA